MAISKAQQKAVAKYDAKAYDKSLLRLQKGKLDIVKAHAAAQGESVNGFINRAIDHEMERDGQKRPLEPAEGPGNILHPDKQNPPREPPEGPQRAAGRG